jgi:hypothetical protein
MTYSAGSTIVAADYNGFRTRLNQVIGLGTENGGSGGNSGYGQTNTISAVSSSNTITANEWTNLFTRLRSTLNHQGSSTTITSGNAATGDTISIKAGLDTDCTTATNNRNNAAAGSLASQVAVTNVHGTTRTSAWNSQIQHVFTITFAASGTAPAGASAQDAARFFFNSGGYLNLAVGGYNGSSSQDTAWSNLLAAAGTIRFGGAATTKSGGSGTPTTLASVGYHQLTTSNQTIFKQFDTTANYTANFVQIDVRTDTVTDPNSRNGKGSVLTVTLTLNDAHTNAFSDTVNLDVVTSCSYVGANTTYLNNVPWTITGATTTSWA